MVQYFQISVSYFMVCAYVREDNPRALARGLSPVHAHNQTITALLHQHACVHCTFEILELSLKDAINRGSYMSAHVLLNLLNELGKRIKM